MSPQPRPHRVVPVRPPVQVVAVFSQQRATADFLKRALDSAGFASFTAPADLSRLDAFVGALQPHAVVVDMALATERAWQELMRVRSSPAWDEDVALVLTTPDESGLRQWMTGPRSGEVAVVELFTHAQDLRDLRRAVVSAVEKKRGKTPPLTRHRPS